MLEWVGKLVTVEQVAIAELVLLIGASVLFAITFFQIITRSELRVKNNNGKYVERMLLSTGTYIAKLGKYEQTKLFLSQHGANYIMGRHVAPEEYALLNLFLAIIFGLIGTINFGIIGFIMGLLFGYNLLKMALIASNKSDNEKILYDMKGIYDTLKMKTEGGMFLTSAIQECYKTARNKRLKYALLELHNEIIVKGDVREAVENLNVKFKNKYIDTFCVIIKQSLESGKTVEILRDMSEQLIDMQQAINVKTKGKLESQISKTQIMIFIGLLMMCMYGLISSIGEFVL